MEGSGVDSSAADQLVAQWVTLQDVKKDFAAANELYDKMRAMGITPAPKLYSLQGDSKGVDVVKVQTKMDQYALLKQHRDFAGCDAIRLELSRLGVSIIDRHRWWKTSNPKAEAILEAQKMAKKAKREHGWINFDDLEDFGFTNMRPLEEQKERAGRNESLR
jgi:Fe2+ transport system protein FeoA